MLKFIYKKKFYRNFFVRKFISLSVRAVHLYDSIRDRRICGCSLVKYVPSLYRETMGATGSESTCYWALDTIFKGFPLDAQDSLIDVGCGKGRVLAYLADKKVPCPLTGIELNQDVYAYAKSWADACPQITLIQGNAFEQDYNRYTVIFLARPFETDAFHQFVHVLEGHLSHKIRMIYWWDTQSGSYLEDRPRWKITRREWIFVSHGCFLYRWPQRFTVWEYDPEA